MIRPLPLLLIVASTLAVTRDGSASGSSPSPSPSPSPAGTPATAPVSTPSPVSATPSPVASPADTALVTRDIPEIHAKISLPADWTFLPGKLLEGDVLLAVREKISGENDPWTTGLSMTIDRNGAADSGMKAGEYAMGIALEAREKAGEEASPITESQKGPFREISFEFPVPSDPPLQITEILRANDRTGTVAVILWQSKKEEAGSLRSLREAILSGLTLDPGR